MMKYTQSLSGKVLLTADITDMFQHFFKKDTLSLKLTQFSKCPASAEHHVFSQDKTLIDPFCL